MATGTDLKNIALKRLESAEHLIKAGDWEGAAYMMGFSLECALKSAICKTLHLQAYPEYTKNKEVASFFMTHKFDCLYVVSGLTDIFNVNAGGDAYWNWSEFTKNYTGNWVETRYQLSNWDGQKVSGLFKYLSDTNHGIITEIESNKRW